MRDCMTWLAGPLMEVRVREAPKSCAVDQPSLPVTAYSQNGAAPEVDENAHMSSGMTACWTCASTKLLIARVDR